ncbi:unnamed protein product [Arctogadus glacialis]
MAATKDFQQTPRKKAGRLSPGTNIQAWSKARGVKSGCLPQCTELYRSQANRCRRHQIPLINRCDKRVNASAVALRCRLRGDPGGPAWLPTPSSDSAALLPAPARPHGCPCSVMRRDPERRSVSHSPPPPPAGGNDD